MRTFCSMRRIPARRATRRSAPGWSDGFRVMRRLPSRGSCSSRSCVWPRIRGYGFNCFDTPAGSVIQKRSTHSLAIHRESQSTTLRTTKVCIVDLSGRLLFIPVILNFRSWQTIVPTFFIFLVCGALLILQRDLGTATLIFAVFTFFIYTINPRKRILIISGIGLIVAALAGSLLFEVIRWRAEAWFNPWLDPTNRSYQIVQSLMAAASGGLFGTGPGMGAPNLIRVACL